MPKPARPARRSPPQRAGISAEALIQRLPASPDEFDRASRVQALREQLATVHPDDAAPPAKKGSR